jgi:hypothetical protein
VREYEGKVQDKEVGMKQAIEYYREEARGERDAEIVKSALAEGASLEFIQKITGLDIGTTNSLAASVQ